MATKATTRGGRKARGGVAADLHLPLDRAQLALRDQARELLSTPELVGRGRRAADTGERHDPELWSRLAALDWPGILVDVAHGGAGGSLLDACVILEEAGRTLLPEPLLATALLGATAATSPDDLAGLAAGRLRATAAPASTVAVTGGTVPRATGVATHVLDADVADILVLGGFDDEERPVALRTTPAEGARVVREASLDATRGTCTVHLDAVPVMILADGDEATALLLETATVGAVGLAAELTGAAARCVEATIDYAKDRKQFGRPIGAYQAVKHRLVDVFMLVEAARAGTRHAARLVDAGDPDRHLVASVARVEANRALAAAATASIQLHGGAGFTWDNDAHLYLKRAKASERLLGDPVSHRRAIAQAFGL